jgi:glycosyltransferase involved in cell wall biosynthesis
MKIAIVHAVYRQRGGEEEVVHAESALLREAGHEVREFLVDNEAMTYLTPVRQAIATIWNGSAVRDLRAFLRSDPPDVAHFHNTFPSLSPAAYSAARAEGIPVVQTLHNYRLVCPSAVLFRDGGVCEECLGKVIPWPGVSHACYRGSRAASAAVGCMLTTHRVAGTWRRNVDIYIALTEFARHKYIEGGLPGPRIVVKPNFVHDPGMGPGPEARESFALFVGRLTPEKGIGTLLDAWRDLADVPLMMVGDGAMRTAIQGRLASREMAGRIDLSGPLEADQVISLMKRAQFLVFPSEWYEGAPRVVIEAMACGLPVIGAWIGAVAEILDRGRTGYGFAPGNASELVTTVRAAVRDRAGLARIGAAGRREFEDRYTANRNLELLEGAYRRAMG